MGPDNFEWRLALVEKAPEESKLEYNKRYRKAHKDFYGTDYHTAQLQRNYGITFYDLQDMAKAQDHKCAICGNPEYEQRNGRVRHLSVDHDHRTGKVRALLCTACNKGLGHFKDDVDLMLKAIAYLRHHETLTKT